MADIKDDGGSAFPGVESPAGGYPGMSLRDYFAAHAPKKPQPWFEPIHRARPEPVYDHEHPNENCWGCSPTNWRDRHDWTVEHATARLIQWPYAWADAMLEARKS